MPKRSKAYRAAAEKIQSGVLYTPAEAVKLAKATSVTKFDSTVDVVLRLGVDPRKADQMVRGTVSLPHGTGKTARVVVFAQGERAQQALDALAAGPDGGAGAVPGVVLPQAGDDDAAHLGALDEQVVGELEEVVGIPGEVVVDDDAGARRGARQAVGLLQPGQGAVGPRPGCGGRGARGAHRGLT